MPRTRINPDHYWTPEIAKIIQRACDDGLITLMGDDERDATRHELLKSVTPGEPVWVFGYGSLMWNPDFPVAETRAALVRGWHRRFCLWTVLGRGTPERPGLMLGLEPGRIMPRHGARHRAREGRTGDRPCVAA